MTRQFAIKTTFDGAIAHEVRYWLGRPMVERVSAVETLRQICSTWRCSTSSR